MASLVYPDPNKKGLGNKARSSVHIGICVNCLRGQGCFDCVVVNVGMADCS